MANLIQTSIQTKTTDSFMELLKRQDIPPYLIELLHLTGFDTAQTLATLNDDDVSEMEKFAREDLPLLKDEREIKEFYGIFAKKPSIFRIPIGHKKLLKILTESCQKLTKSKETPLKVTHRDPKNKRTLDTRSEATSRPDVRDEYSNVTHIKKLVKNYVKQYCETIKDDISSEKSQEILSKLQDENLKVNLFKENNTSGEETWMAKINCLLCEFTSRAYLSKTPSGLKWTLSNFNKHFKTHFNNPKKKINIAKSQRKSTSTSTNKNTLLNFVVIAPKEPVSSVNSAADLSTITDPDLSPLHALSTSTLDDTFSNLEPLKDVELELLDTGETLNIREDSDFPRCRPAAETGTSAKNLTSQTPKGHQIKKYSRHYRKMKILESAGEDTNQSKITDFYEFVENVCKTIEGNYQLQKDFSQVFENPCEKTNPTENSNVESVSKSVTSESDIKGLLKILQCTAIRNSRAKTHGNRFSHPLKLFSLYLFIIGGRLMYESLFKNLEGALPSITTIHRSLENDELQRITEGNIRMCQLKAYLQKREYPLRIFVSEDQTAVIKKVVHDPKSDKLVGFVPSLCGTSGFPDTNNFVASSVTRIEEMFDQETMSNNAYVFMAQPLADKAPAFCLTIFGSDNRFEHKDVINRWGYLEKLAKEEGIEIEGFASDGDTRCLKAMKIQSDLPLKTTKTQSDHNDRFDDYFQMDCELQKPIYIQDPVHIATKMKTRFLKPGIKMPMGTKMVSPEHIETLMNTFTKDKHYLCPSDLKSMDKMNFNAIEKLSSSRVTDLCNEIVDAEGTRQFLTLTRLLTDSFLDKNLSPKQRIYNMWYCTFFIRLWRLWLKENPFTLTENCITSNTYTCIELNSHGLMKLMKKCRDNKTPNLFLPWFYSSQPCEKIFRQTRSMTSTFSTIVNFSIMDLLNRLHKINAINEITTDLGSTFRFPREENRRQGGKVVNSLMLTMDFPTDDQVMAILKEAKTNAMNDATNLGMNMKSDPEDSFKTIVMCKCPEYAPNTLENGRGNKTLEYFDDISSDSDENDVTSLHLSSNTTYCSDPIVVSDCDEDIENEKTLFSSFDTLNLKDYSDKINDNNSERGSQFIKVSLNNKKHVVVRKSTLCWYFSQRNSRLSSDRMLRVRGMTDTSSSKNKPTATVLKKRATQRPKKLKPICMKKKAKVDNVRKKTGLSITEKASPGETTMSTSSSSSESDDEYSVKSDTLTEEFSEESQNDEKNVINVIDLKKEQYYSVYYEHQWYVGKILEIEENKTCSIKFLTSDLENFIWPKQDDIQKVDFQFIFYGPIQLLGNDPFKISRSDRLSIQKKYKDFKRL